MSTEWRRIGVPLTKDEEPTRYRWTAEQALRQLPQDYAVRGKVFMVTGGHSGIGYETTKAFVANGATVIIASRRQAAVEEAMSRIKAEYPDANMIFLQLDLSDLEKVQQCVRDFEATGLPLHGLICNAAAQITGFEYTKQGFEMQFGTNHVGNFLLNQLLVSHLAKSGPHSRIALVSSGAHRTSPVRFDDLDFQGGKVYDKWQAYGQSKSANIICARALTDAYAAKGVEVFSLHPGSWFLKIAENGEEVFFFFWFAIC
jgi:NAD(P)-dependent dehydrogenase (short-subunit alcohol dehydrogenase family)